MIAMFARALLGAMFAVLMLAAAPSQAAKFYIENKLGELAADQKARVESPKPVQLLFQFTTDQKANPKATKYLKKQVTDLVIASGAFSEVSETPVPGGAMLVVTIDNIVQKDAAKQGFRAGLTFGLAKAAVRDGYAVVAEYTAASGATPIRREVSHGMWVTMGTKEMPTTDLLLVKNATVGIETVVRQGVNHAINQVALDPAFAGTAQAAAAPAP